MASGASSLDSSEGSGNNSHSFIPTSERATVTLPTIPLPIEIEGLTQNSEYDKQSNYQVVKQPTYEGMNPSYDSLSQSQYDGLSKHNSDNFKQQCDKALLELNTVRRQHSETSRRCDHAMKELEYFRIQHRVAMTKLDVSSQDANNLRMINSELLNDKQRLEREIQLLTQDGSSPGSSGVGSSVNATESGDTALMHTLRKYDGLKEDYDCLRKRYDEIISTHNATTDQLQVIKEENVLLKTQAQELTQERNSAIRERNGLKQQCTAAIRQWDIALRERNDYRDALGKVSSQHEEAVREMNQAMGVRVKATKDIKRLTEERNAAMHEYSLIMSERDTVHKEMEKLSEDLQRAVKRAQAAETELASAQRERHALALQAESLRREIASALLDRDRALRECSDLSRNVTQNQPNTSKTRLDNSVYHHGHGNSGTGKDGSNGGQLGTDANIDKLQGLVGMVLNPRHKERVDNLETANQELDRLRKTIDKLQNELTEAHQEAEVSKRRRDWAFSERDKIVLERESIRTLCDRLRKERDRAVSDLAEALRDSDDIKKQRNEASKELKELKEKYETELEKDSANCRVHHSGITHNHSRDSAIDADLQEWESEILEVDLASIPTDGDIGLEFVGGLDDPYHPNDCGIYVSSIQKGSVADGKLKVGDCIVDGPGVNSLGSVSHVIEALRGSGGRARLLVRRRRVRSRCLHTAQLNKSSHTDHGLLLEQGIYISKITPGSLAAKEGNLAIGDRVLSVNNKSMDGLKSAGEAMMILNDRHCDMLTITTLKHISHSGSTNSDISSRFSPTKESMGKNSYLIHTNKMVNSCSQTEESWRQYLIATPKGIPPHTFENSVGDVDRRFVYKVSASNQPKTHEKSHSTSGHEKGTWNMIFGKIEAVTGRSKSKDKQNRQSTVPESDAIAELDSVIDSYHGKTGSKESSGSVLKRSKRRNKENSSQENSDSAKNNRGTWPKARSNVTFQQNPTGTIVQPRSKKERLPISILLSPPTKLQQTEPQWNNSNRNSNPIPISPLPLTQSIAPSRHSVYNPMQSPSNPTLHFPKPLSIHNQFAQPNISNYDKIRNIEKDKHLQDFEHDMTPNRLSRNLNPSDDSLDYQTVMRDSKSPNSLDFINGTNKGPSCLEFAPPLPPLLKNPISLDFKTHHEKEILEYYSGKKSKTPSKYSSDSESLGPESLTSGLNIVNTNTLPHSRLPSQFYRASAVPPFVNPHPHHLPAIRYPHPASPTLPITQSQSGESIGGGYECTSFASHSHNVSDIQPNMRSARGNGNDHYHHHGYEGGTFPRKKENQRFRIPSNPSVTSKNSAGKVSTGSIERSSERGSPMPTFHVEVLSPGRGAHAKQLPHTNTRNSMPEYCGLGWPNKPLPGELRRVHIDKIQQPLGIQISCPPRSGGVFVSTVNEHSVASQVGLQIGDQLLEVCGINMRSATYKLAANVLRQCGNSITMLVQYSPDKYNEFEGSVSSSDGEGSGDEVSVSGSPTPRNSPGPQQSLRLEAPSADLSNNRQSQNKDSSESRFLLIEMRKSSDLGISLVGGNAVGIYVHSVQIESPAYNAGLRTGDQILEYNNADLRHATAEQAALELAKPADKVTVLARHDLQRYHEIKDKPGDAFFVRTGFDRNADLASSGADTTFDQYSLWFRRDQVIFVDNTLFNGAPGLWRAWNLDHKGNKQQWGTIPSKFKVEELLRRSVGSLEGGESSQNRRGSTVARRSFFRRKKQRDPKELASFSNTNLGWWSDSGTLNEELLLCSYQRVDPLPYTSHRPVVVLGPLWECVVEKLVTDFPSEFCRGNPEPVPLTGPSLDRALVQGKFLEPRKRGHYLECISFQSIKEVCDKGMHCILDISITSIEKLHKQQIYPIVLLIKFKSPKQIKDVKDTRYPMEKVSAKAAKEMYEHALKLESEFKQYISVEIAPAGINIAYLCTQLKAAIDEEQGKTLWVPSQQT